MVLNFPDFGILFAGDPFHNIWSKYLSEDNFLFDVWMISKTDICIWKGKIFPYVQVINNVSNSPFDQNIFDEENFNDLEGTFHIRYRENTLWI